MIFLLVVLTALLGNALSQDRCPLPTQAEIENAILSVLESTGGDGSSVDSVLLLAQHYNCLATSDVFDRYRSITLAVRYNVTRTPSGSSATITETSVSQLQLRRCSGSMFLASENTLENPGALDVFNLSTRRDCSFCTNVQPQGPVFDAVNNCAREYRVKGSVVLKLL